MHVVLQCVGCSATWSDQVPTMCIQVIVLMLIQGHRVSEGDMYPVHRVYYSESLGVSLFQHDACEVHAFTIALHADTMPVVADTQFVDTDSMPITYSHFGLCVINWSILCTQTHSAN